MFASVGGGLGHDEEICDIRHLQVDVERTRMLKLIEVGVEAEERFQMQINAFG